MLKRAVEVRIHSIVQSVRRLFACFVVSEEITDHALGTAIENAARVLFDQSIE